MAGSLAIALAAQLEALSQSKPVLMIFEDVHWVDPTSLELLGQTVDRLKRLGVLLVITYRPDFDPPWIGRPDVTALSLNRLGNRETAAIIDGLIGDTPLTPIFSRSASVRYGDASPLKAHTSPAAKNASCLGICCTVALCKHQGVRECNLKMDLLAT